MAIPSYFKRLFREYVSGVGSSEVASQAPVQSVNSQTGDVTITATGGDIPADQTVATYNDLPLTDRSQAEIWFVTNEQDIVVSTQLNPVVWRSVSDYTLVASAMPDSVVTQYRYEDDSTPSTAIDSVGSNDGNISGATYTSSSAKGSFALSFDGTDDTVTSGSTIDLSASGNSAGASVGGYFNPDSTSNQVPITWGVDGDNYLSVEITSNGNWAVRAQSGSGTFTRARSTVSVSTSSYTKVFACADSGGDIYLIVDGTEEARTSFEGDITTIGSGDLRVGARVKGSTFYGGLADNSSFATEGLSPSQTSQV